MTLKERNFRGMPRRIGENSRISDVQSDPGPGDIFQTQRRLITSGKVNSTRFGFDLVLNCVIIAFAGHAWVLSPETLTH